MPDNTTPFKFREKLLRQLSDEFLTRTAAIEANSVAKLDLIFMLSYSKNNTPTFEPLGRMPFAAGFKLLVEGVIFSESLENLVETPITEATDVYVVQR